MHNILSFLPLAAGSTFIQSRIWRNFKTKVFEAFHYFRWLTIMHNAWFIFFWFFMNIIFVLELLTLNLVWRFFQCPRNFVNFMHLLKYLKKALYIICIQQKHVDYIRNENFFNTFILSKLGNHCSNSSMQRSSKVVRVGILA